MNNLKPNDLIFIKFFTQPPTVRFLFHGDPIFTYIIPISSSGERRYMLYQILLHRASALLPTAFSYHGGILVAHLSVNFLVFILCLAIMILEAMLCVIIYDFCSLLTQLLNEIIALFRFSILIFTMTFYINAQIADYRAHNRYLRHKAELKREKDFQLILKQIIHNLHIKPTRDNSEKYATFLRKVVEELMQSPLFLEDKSLRRWCFSFQGKSHLNYF